jgi:hypothetical protein
MTEHLRSGGQERRHGRYIDVAPLRVLPANDEVEFVAEEAVVPVPHRMERERRDSRQDWNSQALAHLANNAPYCGANLAP